MTFSQNPKLPCQRAADKEFPVCLTVWRSTTHAQARKIVEVFVLESKARYCFISEDKDMCSFSSFHIRCNILARDGSRAIFIFLLLSKVLLFNWFLSCYQVYVYCLCCIIYCFVLSLLKDRVWTEKSGSFYIIWGTNVCSASACQFPTKILRFYRRSHRCVRGESHIRRISTHARNDTMWKLHIFPTEVWEKFNGLHIQTVSFLFETLLVKYDSSNFIFTNRKHG